MRTRLLVRALVLSAATTVTLSACSHGGTTAAPRRTTSGADVSAAAGAAELTARFGDFPAYAATARPASVRVFDAPGGTAARSLRNPQPSGAPLTFMLKAALDGWLEVYLPVRPNGSTGWVREADVAVAGVNYRVDVHLRSHELWLFERGRQIATFPVGVGTGSTPTPGGVFYLKELLRPTNTGGVYGPYAYGLSGFSNVLTRFGTKGEGVIGLHGTDDESTIGRDVSHGCIRMRNRDITRLARLLPLGTPVRILT